MKVNFTITVDQYSDGRIEVWSQQKEKLQARDLERFNDLKVRIERICQPQIVNELKFERSKF